MRYSIEIGKIVEGALKNDLSKVQNYCEQLINKLEADDDIRSANKFRKLLDASEVTTMSPMNNSRFNVPVDSESRASLADIVYPCENNVDTILSEINEKQVFDFINNYKHADELHSLGLQISNSLLLYGPPGCGKTNCGYMIAKKLNLPLVIARLDSMISSYLGTTAKNIRALFDYIQKTPCVLFLDEFDALAKARDDNNELGELKRVVNSLLQNVDNMSKDSIVIAATNHEKLLDPAIWRRFDYKINVLKPDNEAIIKLINLFSKDKICLSDRQTRELSLCFNGLSGADIKEILNKSFRNDIVNGKTICLESIYEQIFFANSLYDKYSKAMYLRQLNYKGMKFTLEFIGELLGGVSKSTISNLLKDGELNGRSQLTD